MSEEKKTQETTNSSIVFSKKRAILLLSVTAIIAILIIAIVLIYHKVYYADRWYKNTTINGVDVSGQTLESSKKNLEKKYADYSLTISGRDKGQMQIDGNDIGYHFKIGSSFDKIFDKQHEAIQLFAKKNAYTTDYNISYDDAALKKIVKKAEIVKGSATYKVQKPVYATVVYNKYKSKY